MADESQIIEIFKRVPAIFKEALALARTRNATRITALRLTLFDHSPETAAAVRGAFEQLLPNTLAQGASIVLTPASTFICWNCCGLRYQSIHDNTCPNCGSVGEFVPPEILFSLDHVETAND